MSKGKKKSKKIEATRQRSEPKTVTVEEELSFEFSTDGGVTRHTPKVIVCNGVRFVPEPVRMSQEENDALNILQFFLHLREGISDCIGLDRDQLKFAKVLRRCGWVTVVDSPRGPLVALTDKGVYGQKHKSITDTLMPTIRTELKAYNNIMETPLGRRGKAVHAAEPEQSEQVPAVEDRGPVHADTAGGA